MILLLAACGLRSGAEDTSLSDAPPDPLAALDRSGDLSAFAGPVEERLDAGGYAYLRVEGRWVAGLDHGEGVGDRVRVQPLGVVRGFRSARTGRTFEELRFGVFAAAPAP